MNLAAMRQRVEDTKAAGLDFVTLVHVRGLRMPPRFPRGELLCVNSAGDDVRSYSASKLLKWIDWADAATQ